MIVLIIVKSKTEEAELTNAVLQAARSSPEQKAQGLGSAGMELQWQKCPSAQTLCGFQPSCQVVGVWPRRFPR